MGFFRIILGKTKHNYEQPTKAEETYGEIMFFQAFFVRPSVRPSLVVRWDGGFLAARRQGSRIEAAGTSGWGDAGFENSGLASARLPGFNLELARLRGFELGVCQASRIWPTKNYECLVQDCWHREVQRYVRSYYAIFKSLRVWFVRAIGNQTNVPQIFSEASELSKKQFQTKQMRTYKHSKEHTSEI